MADLDVCEDEGGEKHGNAGEGSDERSQADDRLVDHNALIDNNTYVTGWSDVGQTFEKM